MLKVEDGSCPYIQYAAVRGQKILPKPDTEIEPSLELKFETIEEQNIINTLAEFPRAIELAYSKKEPHRIGTYLSKLATYFNTFYTHCPVTNLDAVSPQVKNSRLLLVQTTSTALKKGRRILV